MGKLDGSPQGKPILVSACLAGLDCCYDGKNKRHKLAAELVRGGKAIPICPEQMGGLSTPRVPAEIVGGTGAEVLKNEARVMDANGKDVTDSFKKGAAQVLRLAKLLGCKRAILKDKSPSCGANRIFNGSFEGVLKEGQGVTAALLIEEGIEVVSENDF